MSRLKRFILILIVVAISPIHLFAQATSSSKPIPIKVVIVAMFERSEDTGDTPGEYQLWVEREHLEIRNLVVGKKVVNLTFQRMGTSVVTYSDQHFGGVVPVMLRA